MNDTEALPVVMDPICLLYELPSQTMPRPWLLNSFGSHLNTIGLAPGFFSLIFMRVNVNCSGSIYSKCYTFTENGTIFFWVFASETRLFNCV